MKIKEIEFEEDEWRHDDQFVFEDNKAELLIDFEKLKTKINPDQADDTLLQADEDIILHYIVKLNNNKFIIFPLKDSIFIGRGIIVELKDGEISKITSTKAPDT